MSDTLEVFGHVFNGVTGFKATDDNGNTKTYIRPTGTVSITDNGTVDVTQYASASVSVSGGSPNLQDKSVTPTESEQSIQKDSGYDGLGTVTVGAISSTYVGSGITQRSSSNLSASGATVTAPSGYYSSDATKSVASGSVTAPASISGSSAAVSASSNTLTLSKTVSVTPSVTTAGYISSGTAGNSDVSLSASVNTRSSLDLTASGATVTAPAGYYGSDATKSVESGSVTAPASITGSNSSATTIGVSNSALEISETISVTPNVTSAGYISSGTAGNCQVTLSKTVNVINTQQIYPSESRVILAAGSYLGGTVYVEPAMLETKSESANGTYTPGSGYYGFGSFTVDVPFVHGEFTTKSTRNSAGTFRTGYTGSGYPIMIVVYIKGGPYNNGTGGNTTWYNSKDRYDVGYVSLVKSRVTTQPTYATSGADNYGSIVYVYKNSTSDATSFSRSSSMTANSFTSSSGAASGACIRFNSATQVAYFVGNKTSSTIGLPPSTDFEFVAVYSG